MHVHPHRDGSIHYRHFGKILLYARDVIVFFLFCLAFTGCLLKKRWVIIWLFEFEWKLVIQWHKRNEIVPLKQLQLTIGKDIIEKNLLSSMHSSLRDGGISKTKSLMMNHVGIICLYFSVACNNAGEEKATLPCGYTEPPYCYRTRRHLIDTYLSKRCVNVKWQKAICVGAKPGSSNDETSPLACHAGMVGGGIRI